MPDPASSAPDPAGHLWRDASLLLLSFAAGCVDAIGFIHVGVFPANMTGTTVILAVDLLNDPAHMLPRAYALIAFVVGAAVGAAIVHSRQRGWTGRVTLALFVAGLLVLAAALGTAAFGVAGATAVLIVAALAMGIQSASVQQLGVTGVATVFMTGTLTASAGRLVGYALDRPSREPSHWLPGFTWLFYFSGAVIGSLSGPLGMAFPYVLPPLILLAVAAASAPRPQAFR